MYVGLKTGLFWCLMLLGFVGFQFAEDGTPLSLWTQRISSLIFWVIGFAISAGTYKGSIRSQGALWFFEFVFPVIIVFIYVVSQVVLVLRTLDERWPINDIATGVLAFVAGLILMYGFNNQICENVKHYIDGTFFGTLCTLLAVMLVYKFWDSITREDLEFSVGSRHTNWDTKEAIPTAEFDGSMASHDMFGRNSISARQFNVSRTPSPHELKESAAQGYSFDPAIRRPSSSNGSFVAPR